MSDELDDAGSELVPWQLEWRDDNSAMSIRNPDAWYQVSRMGALGDSEDAEAECLTEHGSVYLGIFASEAKGKAACEYHELTGDLPPEAPPPPPEPKDGFKILLMFLGIFLAWQLARAIILVINGGI